MKTILQLATVVLLVVGYSQAQHTTTVYSNGQETRITCDHAPSTTCVVDDGPAEHHGLGDQHADNKARVQWCTAQGFKSTKGGQTVCGLSWQDHKAAPYEDSVCSPKFGEACKR